MSRPDYLRAAVGGTLAGLIGGAAMNGFQALWTTVQGDDGGGDDPATLKAADRLARAITGQPIPRAHRDAADPAVHYAMSAVLGLAYGIATEAVPRLAAGFGTGFGVATLLVIDEGAVPAAGLAPPPHETPLATHLYAAASHLVFGAALELARRAAGGRVARG